MKNVYIFACLFSLFVTIDSTAASAVRQVTVTSLHPIANERPHSAGTNLTRVYVNSGAWGKTSCRTDAADLKKEDSHILSQLLWAISSKKSIKIEVNDTLRPFDTVCQITALFIVNL